MSELISGKEALIALANGEEVEFKRHVNNSPWLKAKELKASEILNLCMVLGINNYSIEFRLKPRTITINGIEVPAPFEPKDGDEFWILFESHYSPCGYKLVLPDSQYSELCYGAWHTEDEIKQVVAALRSIFK